VNLGNGNVVVSFELVDKVEGEGWVMKIRASSSVQVCVCVRIVCGSC